MKTALPATEDFSLVELGTVFKISSFVIRPAFPDPSILSTSIFFSLAIFAAAGIRIFSLSEGFDILVSEL